MKIRPRKAMMIGLAATTVFSVTGCNKKENQNGEVYGPPNDLMTTESNYIETVYGPPEAFTDEKATDEKSTGENTEITTEKKSEEFSVDENDPIDVYGPPEDF